MASLLDRLGMPPASSSGPIRSKGTHSNRSNAPYSRTNRPPKGDINGQWAHDLFEGNSLSARLSSKPVNPPKANLNPLAQKALREATTSVNGNATEQLSIKGASLGGQGNVVEVTGLAQGTTAEDVATIFKTCGEVVSQKLVGAGQNPKVRVTFKQPASANAAVQKFDNQHADGKVLSVRIVGSHTAGTSLAGRIGGTDGLGLVREEGSVDVLMDTDSSVGSKLRSDSLIGADPRAQVLVAPPGTNPADYVQAQNNRGGARRGRGRGARRGRGGLSAAGSRMDLD
ncbi:hypothetical protein AX16_003977 [Volvariella volvacea WC 439]|nr:hypothetical protein AX16_003977 [Volvariella volvacea WC 439]